MASYLLSYRFGTSRPCRKWTPSERMTTRCARWCPHTTCSSAALWKPLRSVALHRWGKVNVCRDKLNQAANIRAGSVPFVDVILAVWVPWMVWLKLHGLVMPRREWGRIRSTRLWEPVWRVHAVLVSPWWRVGGMREWKLNGRMISSLWDFPVYKLWMFLRWWNIALSLSLCRCGILLARSWS